ncbi:helix-turn-helix domain-containing protein [Bordetella petrii]|nr:helix-turn-helix transcriptional regulator [Bordetella petrii]
METFGQRVRGARLRFGWTQKELASVSGLTQSAIGNYESGQRTEPTSAALIKLAQALDVTPEWLRQGKEAKDGPSKKSLSYMPKARQQKGLAAGWPFHEVGFDEFMALSLAEKRMLGTMVAAFVRSCLAQK